MGFTRYWTPKKIECGYSQEFLDDVNKILQLANKKYNVKCGNGISEDCPIIKKDGIILNGLAVIGQDHETFALEPNGEWNFCKTARKDYDIIVNAILQLADKYNYLEDLSSDGENNEEWANELLKGLTKKEKQKSYYKNFYYVLSYKKGIEHFAIVICANNCNNILSLIGKWREIGICYNNAELDYIHLAKTKKEAQEIADAWNENWKNDGLLLEV